MKCKLVNENFKTDYIDSLLKCRGIKEPEEYYNPTVKCIQDPIYLDNVHEGLKLYTDVLDNDGLVLLLPDCDNDGYTSASLMYEFTKRIYPDAKIDFLIHEGKQHGLEDHIDTILNSDKHYDLIIIPDASSNDYVFHEQLKEINTPVLVLDHHITDEQISSNAIIINNQLSKNYLNKELTGAGVVYQFCRYYDYIFDTHYADDYMDLAAWGIN